MSIFEFSIKTKGFNDIIDITPKVEECVKKSEIKEGTVLIFVPGSTVGLTTLEYEEGLIKDLKQTLEKIAPQNQEYEHNKRWGDGNGFSHIRSALLPPSLTIPIQNSQLTLGTWQQIVLIDFDNRPRERKVIVKVIG
jgi:secondary thiamine-phosphate synthase enzyme